ncbi:MAG: hypothetical protein V8R75_09145 [Oscillospiraceae bacterium]
MQQVEWAKPVVHIYDKGVYNNADILEWMVSVLGGSPANNLVAAGPSAVSHLPHLTLETKQVTAGSPGGGIAGRCTEQQGLDSIKVS